MSLTITSTSTTYSDSNELYELKYSVPTLPQSGSLKIRFQRLTDITDLYREIVLNDIKVEDLGQELSLLIQTINLEYETSKINRIDFPNGDDKTNETDAQAEDVKNVVSGYVVPYQELFRGSYTLSISYIEDSTSDVKSNTFGSNIVVETPYYVIRNTSRHPTENSIRNGLDKKEYTRIMASSSGNFQTSVYIPAIHTDYQLISGSMKIYWYNVGTSNNDAIMTLSGSIAVGTGSPSSFTIRPNNIGLSTGSITSVEGSTSLSDFSEYKTILEYKIENKTDPEDVKTLTFFSLSNNFTQFSHPPAIVTHPEDDGFYNITNVPLEWSFPQLPSIAIPPTLVFRQGSIAGETIGSFVLNPTKQDEEEKNIFILEQKFTWNAAETNIVDSKPDLVQTISQAMSLLPPGSYGFSLTYRGAVYGVDQTVHRNFTISDITIPAAISSPEIVLYHDTSLDIDINFPQDILPNSAYIQFERYYPASDIIRLNLHQSLSGDMKLSIPDTNNIEETNEQWTLQTARNSFLDGLYKANVYYQNIVENDESTSNLVTFFLKRNAEPVSVVIPQNFVYFYIPETASEIKLILTPEDKSHDPIYITYLNLEKGIKTLTLSSNILETNELYEVTNSPRQLSDSNYVLNIMYKNTYHNPENSQQIEGLRFRSGDDDDPITEEGDDDVTTEEEEGGDDVTTSVILNIKEIEKIPLWSIVLIVILGFIIIVLIFVLIKIKYFSKNVDNSQKKKTN